MTVDRVYCRSTWGFIYRATAYRDHACVHENPHKIIFSFSSMLPSGVVRAPGNDLRGQGWFTLIDKLKFCGVFAGFLTPVQVADLT